MQILAAAYIVIAAYSQRVGWLTVFSDGMLLISMFSRLSGITLWRPGGRPGRLLLS